MQCHYAGIADWSKRGRDEVTANGETRWSEVTRAVLDLIGDRRTIWMANKDTDADVQKIIADKLAADQERDPKVTTSSIVQLPNTPHGMNIFQDATCCVVTSALNASPAHFAFLASRGVDPNALRTATYRSAVYQAWMRSSARNPAAGSNKMLIVMDRDTADFMANEVFPGMRVAPVPGLGLGRDRSRPRKYAVGIDRKKAYADRIKQELLGELLALNETDIRSLAQRDEEEIEKLGHHIFSKVDEVKNRIGPQVQVFRSLNSSKPFLEYDIRNHEDLIAFLKDMATGWIADTKDEQVLISAAHFDPDASELHDRGMDNINYIYGLWIDADGGDLTPNQFAELLPYARIVIYETYSSTNEKMRWRAYIPTSHGMTPRVHACLLRQIVQVVNEAGFWSKKQLDKNAKIKSRKCHGFDASKYNGASLFYLPSTRSGRKTFFKDFNDARRAPVDVPKWIEFSIEDLSPEATVVPAPDPLLEGQSADKIKLIQALRRGRGSAGGVNELAVEMAKSDWHAARKGEGNRKFWEFACALRDAGMDHPEIEQMLRAECRSSGSDGNDRRKQIASIMRNLRRRGTFRPVHGNSAPSWLQ